MKSTLVISASSDIGSAYASHCFRLGVPVIGTYRDISRRSTLLSICSNTFHLDLSDDASIDNFKNEYSSKNLTWSTLVFCPCQPFPYTSFFSSSFSDWVDSFKLNSLRQLELLHWLHPYRDTFSKVLFFAGGGTNSAVHSFSAYTSAKLHLIKMVELLDYENKDMSLSILGPGWVNTKTHLNVLRHSSPDTAKYQATSKFIADPRGATPMDDVIRSILWIFSQPKEIVGGRNFSSAYDPIDSDHPDASKLVALLEQDFEMFKLRRSGNNLFPTKRFN